MLVKYCGGIVVKKLNISFFAEYILEGDSELSGLTLNESRRSNQIAWKHQ